MSDITIDRISKVYTIIRIRKKSWNAFIEKLLWKLAKSNNYQIIRRNTDTEYINLEAELKEMV